MDSPIAQLYVGDVSSTTETRVNEFCPALTKPVGNTVSQVAAQGYSSGMNDVAHSFSVADHGKQSVSHLCGARPFVVMFDDQDLLEP